MQSRNPGQYLWLGLALSSLFFYPLFASLSDGLYYMQWQVRNTFELLTCLLLASVFTGIVIALAENKLNELASAVVLSFLVAVPFASFAIHLVRQTGLISHAKKIGELANNNVSLVLVVAALLMLAFTYFIVKWKHRMKQVIINSILVVSPISIICLLTLFQYGTHSVTVALENEPVAKQAERSDIHVLLFDELDYSYLYENGNVSDRYPAFREISRSGVNYHNARAPGNKTLTSIPGILLETRDLKIRACGDQLCDYSQGGSPQALQYEGNIFRQARAAGYRTVIIGWMHSYCEQFREYLDACRSYSLYNYASVNSSFSLLNPVFTNFILWPHQFPYGLLKVPVYSWFQKRVVEETQQAALRELDGNAPLFMVTHYSIPHLPFVYDKNGYNPPAKPFLQNDKNYTDQLDYVDKVLQEFIDSLRKSGRYDRANIVILSDHSYRIMQSKDNWDHVPLIVRKAGNNNRMDVNEETRAELILPALLAGES
ncbi:MAG: sulfatase-like hydrolase/transferase [Gammaproteobacteria bacterium]|nr:sulfatase-like hydrolase/transferase [Gammaproteobacteria bacterium]NIO61300.1 sulfatase-like hydrolase/transferase [Gammaproteobacteria bacterium]NIT12792.1 sulfatase-like hydrolase/transferase [Candidatus Dadabacteria bacterium]NIT40892.1 sulfatase-like hydrolase/transferase [Gammaproteobacteria bacterium]